MQTTEVAECTGVNYNTLLYWCREGVIPKEMPGKQWTSISWNLEDVVVVAVTASLRSHGVPTDVIRKAVRRDLSKISHLVVDNGGCLHEVHSAGPLRALICSNEFCSITNVKKIRERLKGAAGE